MIFVMVFTLVGCGSQDVNNEGEQQSEEATSKKNTAKNVNTVPETVEMYKIADEVGDYGFPTPWTCSQRGPGFFRTSLVFDQLIWFDQNGYNPLLAESWEWADDYKSINFKLRDNVYWHDGEKFTADDVVFSFDYYKEHPYLWVDSGNVNRAEKVNDYEINIILDNTSAIFLRRVAAGLPMIPKHIYENISDPSIVKDKAIGTGPYKLADYNKEQGTYLYEANENYYLGEPYVKKISYVKMGKQMIPEAVMSGTVNAAGIPGEMIEKCKEKGLTVNSNFHEWNCKLMYNHNEKPFSDREFRQALAYAVDKEKLVEIGQRGFAAVGQPGLFPPENPWYCEDTVKYENSLEKSKDLLEGLGYETGDKYYSKDGEALGFELITWSRFSRDAELIKTDLENAGIKVNVKILEKGTVDTKVTERDFDAAISGHGVPGEPDIIRKVLLSNYNNSALYDKNEHLNDLLLKQTTEMNEEKRKELVDEIQNIYAEELPALTLYYTENYFAHDGQVNLCYVPGGIAIGIPMCENKLAFVKNYFK